MAKVTSLIKFQGTLDGVTIDKDGNAKGVSTRVITAKEVFNSEIFWSDVNIHHSLKKIF